MSWNWDHFTGVGDKDGGFQFFRGWKSWGKIEAGAGMWKKMKGGGVFSKRV